MLTRLSLIFLFFLAGASICTADIAPGKILVARVSGDVYYKESPSATQQILVKGTELKTDAVVITKIQSSAILLFSTGSTLLVKPESSIHIEEYLVQATSGDSSDLPTNSSKTTLRLLEGDIVGHVKKLSANDSFNINALSYTAGIRGTDWWMKLAKTQRYEMVRMPSGGSGRAYKTIPTQMDIRWGFGVAEGSAMLSGPGMEPMPVGNKTVVNVTGTLSPKDTIDGADMSPGTMPEQQFEAITEVSEMTQSMFTEE